LLALSAILDQMTKLKILSFRYENFDPLILELNLGKMKEKLCKIFTQMDILQCWKN